MVFFIMFSMIAYGSLINLGGAEIGDLPSVEYTVIISDHDAGR